MNFPFLMVEIAMRMRTLNTLLFICLFSWVMKAQTLEEVETRLDTSKIDYVFYVKDVDGIQLDKSEPLPDILCRKKVNGNNKTTYFRLHGDNDINFLKAEKDVDTLMFEAAREKYLALLDSFPEDTYLMTRVGYTYEREENNSEALKWYQKTLDGNDLAFDTRKRMARILVKEKDTKAKALDHIIKASIMNRNDADIETMLIKVAQANKSKYDGWDFKALALFSANEEKDRIIIDIPNEYWRGYSLSQAAYLFEPGYKEALTERTAEQLTVTPYRESLMILYNSIRKKKVKDPMLKTLKKAVKLGLLEEFMIYEIFLPLDAYALFYLDEEQKTRVYRYVKEAKLCLKK